MSHITQMKCIETSSALPSATLIVMTSLAPIVGFSLPRPPPGRTWLPPPPTLWCEVSSLEAFVDLALLMVQLCAVSSQRPSSGVPSSDATPISITCAPDMVTLVQP